MNATFFFFFNDTATTEIYTLSLHDALPIYGLAIGDVVAGQGLSFFTSASTLQDIISHLSGTISALRDRKSTRLNPTHQIISYALFCFTKKKKRFDTLQSRSHIRPTSYA